MNHTILLKNDGTVWDCGYNTSGQLGDGTTTNQKTLVQMHNSENVKQITCGNYHTILLKEDGTVWGCGYNNFGQLGLGHTNNVTSLTQIPNASNVKQIICGDNHTLLLKNDETVWACGYNECGQLGLGNTNKITSLTQIPNASNVKQIAGGANHTLILKNDGTVWGCGYNYNGQLGDGTTTDQTTLIQIPNATDVKQIACGSNHTLLLKEDGTVWACGQNSYGQLGNGTTTNQKTLIQMPNATNVKMLMNVTANDILFLLYANEKYYSFSDNGIYEVDSVDKINENGFINLNLINNYLSSTPKESLLFDSYKLISTDKISAYKSIYNKSYMIIPNNSITIQDVLKIQNNIINHNSNKYDIFYTFSLDDGNTWQTVDSDNNLVSFPNFTMPTSTTSTEWNTLKTLVLENGIKSTNTSFTILNDIYDSISFRIILVIKMKKYIQDNELITNGITSIKLTSTSVK